MLNKWRQYMRAGGFSENTIDLYLRTMQELPVSPTSLTAEVVEEFIEGQIEHNSRSTANTKLQVIRSFARWAEERNLLAGVLEHLPSKVKAPEPEVYVPPRQDITDVAATLPHPHRLAMLMMADAGTRINETTRLKTQDVDLIHGTVRVVGKGAKAREVPISTDRLRMELEKAISTGRKWLVPGRSGHMTTSNLRKAIATACKRAGVKKITPHSLRHSFAAHSARSLVATKSIQKVLGHSSLGTTDRYLRSLETKEEVVEAYAGFKE